MPRMSALRLVLWGFLAIFDFVALAKPDLAQEAT